MSLENDIIMPPEGVPFTLTQPKLLHLKGTIFIFPINKFYLKIHIPCFKKWIIKAKLTFMSHF